MMRQRALEMLEDKAYSGAVMFSTIDFLRYTLILFPGYC